MQETLLSVMDVVKRGAEVRKEARGRGREGGGGAVEKEALVFPDTGGMWRDDGGSNACARAFQCRCQWKSRPLKAGVPYAGASGNPAHLRQGSHAPSRSPPGLYHTLLLNFHLLLAASVAVF